MISLSALWYFWNFRLNLCKFEISHQFTRYFGTNTSLSGGLTVNQVSVNSKRYHPCPEGKPKQIFKICQIPATRMGFFCQMPGPPASVIPFIITNFTLPPLSRSQLSSYPMNIYKFVATTCICQWKYVRIVNNWIEFALAITSWYLGRMPCLSRIYA